MKTIFERFDYSRRQLNVSYKELGELFSITPDAVRKGIVRENLKDFYVNTFADKYGISKTWIYKGEGEMFTKPLLEDLKETSKDDLFTDVLVDKLFESDKFKIKLKQAQKEISSEELISIVLKYLKEVE